VKQAVSIAIGADHHGFAQKYYLTTLWKQNEYAINWYDVGSFDDKPSDYPVYARAACEMIRKKEVDYGVLLCGSGVGMAIMANRYCGVYAGVAWNTDVARAAKRDDNINVLVLPSDFVSNEQVSQIVTTWLTTEFVGNRHAQRIAMIDHVTCKE